MDFTPPGAIAMARAPRAASLSSSLSHPHFIRSRSGLMPSVLVSHRFKGASPSRVGTVPLLPISAAARHASAANSTPPASDLLRVRYTMGRRPLCTLGGSHAELGLVPARVHLPRTCDRSGGGSVCLRGRVAAAVTARRPPAVAPAAAARPRWWRLLACPRGDGGPPTLACGTVTVC
jgi:hypothetical protein